MTTTEIVNKSWVELHLDQLWFVEWDRYTFDVVEDDQRLLFYGWIDRDDDYRDFVVIEMWNEAKELSHTTSSAEYSRKISELLYGDTSTHNDCQRVEDKFDVKNVIEL